METTEKTHFQQKTHLNRKGKKPKKILNTSMKLFCKQKMCRTKKKKMRKNNSERKKL